MLSPEQAMEKLHAKAAAKRRKLAPPPPSHRPHRCVVLAVDPGDPSGWSIWAAGRYVQSGEVDPHEADALDRVIAALPLLCTMTDPDHCPAVLVLERPWSRRVLGPSRALWAKAWERAGYSARRIVRAWPSRWRSQLLGTGGRMNTEQHRTVEGAHALSVVVAQTGREAAIRHDEAAAICIGHWAARAGEVSKVIPRSYRGA